MKVCVNCKNSQPLSLYRSYGSHSAKNCKSCYEQHSTTIILGKLQEEAKFKKTTKQIDMFEAFMQDRQHLGPK